MSHPDQSPTASPGACNPEGGTDTIIVLGIGNVLWADEGFGVRCVEALQQRWEMAPGVELVDGGTQGLYLVHYVQAASHLLIFDAVDYGLAPGEIKIVEDDEVPKFMGAKKMSLHQTGFQEVLMLAKLTERFPRKVLLVGCQPEQIDDYGGSLTPKVKAALEQALDIGVKALQQWGAAPRVRTTPLNPLTAAAFNPLDMAAYEAGRPSEDEACRVGDDRFMPPATALAGER